MGIKSFLQYGADEVTDIVYQYWGVRQGCIWSTYLFKFLWKSLFIDDKVKEDKRDLAVGKITISGLLFAYDLAKPSFNFIGLQKVITQVAKHCREWGLKHNLHKTKILVCQTGTKLKVQEDYRWTANKKNSQWNNDPEDAIQKRCSDSNIHWQVLSKNSLV